MIKINKNKQSVLIETINPDDNSIVIVKEYDTDTKTITGMIYEECEKKEAFETYNVVGEIVNGELRLLDTDTEDDFDYEEYSGTSIDDDDD